MSGAEGILDALFVNTDVYRFSDFSENPKLEDIEPGIAAYRSFQPDLVIAIGGGSAIDTAKLINILAVQDGDAREIALGRHSIDRKGVQCIAVPTTAGAGSEATHFAVLYIDDVKYSLAHEFILPDVAVVDPQLTYTLGPRQTAVSGIDALCQAVESFWSIHSTEESKIYAKKAITGIIESLPRCVNSPDIYNREIMMSAAHDAGKAINISKTTASHALSYTMTSRYGVPHGQAVCLTLPEFFEFNFSTTENNIAEKRGIEYVQSIMNELLSLFHVSTAAEGKAFLKEFIGNIGLSVNLSQVGIGRADIPQLVQTVNIDRLQNNPRTIMERDITMILENIIDSE